MAKELRTSLPPLKMPVRPKLVEKPPLPGMIRQELHQKRAFQQLFRPKESR